MRPSVVEFYRAGAKTRGLIAVVETNMVPPAESLVNIRGVTFRVVEVTYCVDHADDSAQTKMRANVALSTTTREEDDG